MPYKRNRKCNIPQCNNFTLTDNPYCVKHKREKACYYTNASKKTYTSNEMYDHRWKKLRLLVLRKNPFCVECLKYNRYTPASEVDHIIPHRGDKTNFYNEENLQALCKPCHSQKTGREIDESIHKTPRTQVCR